MRDRGGVRRGIRAGAADAGHTAGANRSRLRRGANNCAPTESTPQGNIAPQGTTTGQRTEPLGDKLAKSDGVLCPPAGVDPAMHAPTPDAGNTPVIRPPGSPGGDPTIRPK